MLSRKKTDKAWKNTNKQDNKFKIDAKNKEIKGHFQTPYVNRKIIIFGTILP